MGRDQWFPPELFDIVNIWKRDAGGVWRRADLVTSCTLVMTYVTTFLFMKLRSLDRTLLARGEIRALVISLKRNKRFVTDFGPERNAS